MKQNGLENICGGGKTRDKFCLKIMYSVLKKITENFYKSVRNTIIFKTVVHKIQKLDTKMKSIPHFTLTRRIRKFQLKVSIF